jgi:hypothetical protein
MTIRAWLLTMICVLFTLSTAGGCRSGTDSSDSAEDAVLVGTWKAEYDEREFHRRGCFAAVTGVETLILRADGTYQQIYDDGEGYVYTSPWNEWYQRDNRVHLDGGRFYPLGIEDAEKLADGRMSWHTDDDGTGHPLDLDNTTGITLQVTRHWYVLEGEREVTLDYPPVCDLDSPVIVEFHRVDTSVSPTAP